jgi:hypothetical protein
MREWSHLRVWWRLSQDNVFLRRNDASILEVNTAPYVNSQPFPGYGIAMTSSNYDFSARQGVGGGSGYAVANAAHGGHQVGDQ